MVKRFKKFDPQLVVVEQLDGSAIALTNEAKLSLYKKSQKSGIPTNVLETVYYRGYSIWNESFNQTPEQFAFDRVNSFIAGGFAADLDDDLMEAFITPHRKIIHHDTWGYAVGSKKNKAHVFTSEASAEKHAKNLKDRNPHLKLTPVRKHPTSTDPDLAKMHIIAASNVRRTDLAEDYVEEDSKGYKNPTGGLTQKGRDHYNNQTGGHLKAPVTTPPSKLKAGSKAAGRRKSFCARMGGVEGPMKKPNGEPTRKALALRKWNCEETELEEKRGLWDNIHAKQERIKHGSGEHMRKPGSKGAPSAADLKNSQNEEYTGSDPKSNDPNNPLARMDGTYRGAKTYADKTPGQQLAHKPSTLKTIKKIVKEEAASDSDKLSKFRKDLADNKAKIEIDMAEKGEKHPATQQPADFLSRKRHAEKYTPDGIEKPTKAGDGFGSVQQHLRGTLSQQVHSNQGGKFNIQKNK